MCHRHSNAHLSFLFVYGEALLSRKRMSFCSSAIEFHSLLLPRIKVFDRDGRLKEKYNFFCCFRVWRTRMENSSNCKGFLKVKDGCSSIGKLWRLGFVTDIGKIDYNLDSKRRSFSKQIHPFGFCTARKLVEHFKLWFFIIYFFLHSSDLKLPFFTRKAISSRKLLKLPPIKVTK